MYVSNIVIVFRFLGFFWLMTLTGGAYINNLLTATTTTATTLARTHYQSPLVQS